MCTSPITLTRHYGNTTRQDVVPCGKCPECLKKLQSGYACRCIEEAKKYGNVWFATLTYSPEHCPVVEKDGKNYNTLHRSDIKFWKREVRKAYYRKYKKPFPRFSFFCCGEYGSRTKRPHYHLFLCGLDLKHAQILEKYWLDHFGFTCFMPISALSDGVVDDTVCVARYVAKYCLKPSSMRYPFNGIVEKPRVMTSPGFGLPDDFDRYASYVRDGLDKDSRNFSPDQVSTINRRCKYVYNGVEFSLPSYLRKKIFYVKNFKGNLQSTSLSHACARALRIDAVENLFRELAELDPDFQERETAEKVAIILSNDKFNLESRFRVSRDDLLNYLNKDSF